RSVPDVDSLTPVPHLREDTPQNYLTTEPQTATTCPLSHLQSPMPISLSHPPLFSLPIKLESFATCEIASVNDIRGLLSFANPNKLRLLCLQTPFIDFTDHSIVFDDHEAPQFTLTYCGDGADPRFDSRILDLTDFTRLESFQMHGEMQFRQGTRVTPPGISTHIPWVTQVIERLPRPDNVGLSVINNTQGPSLCSVRVILDVKINVRGDDDLSWDVFTFFDFSPLVIAMKKMQHQYRQLRDIACSLVFTVTIRRLALYMGHGSYGDEPDYSNDNLSKDNFLKTLNSNPTLQDYSDDNKLIVQVLYVRPSRWVR
ncbi:hypothetical protein CVT24_001822, partial [Panaeolus cyanescens]